MSGSVVGVGLTSGDNVLCRVVVIAGEGCVTRLVMVDCLLVYFLGVGGSYSGREA